MGYGMDKTVSALKASNSKVDSQILLNFKPVQDFMHVLFICNFHNELIKYKNIELVRDLMSVPVTCKIEDLIKIKACRVHNICSGAQGQGSQKLMIRCDRNSTTSEILCLSWLPESLMKNWSKIKVLSCPQEFPHYKSMGNSFDAKGWVTLEQIFWSGQKSNLSEYLCLSLLHASFTKIW